MSFDTATRAVAVAGFHHPSIWLVVPTLSLLVGQAMAPMPLVIPVECWFLLFLPLLLVIKARTRRWGLLVFAAGLGVSLGYIRHWQLLHPNFSPQSCAIADPRWCASLPGRIAGARTRETAESKPLAAAVREDLASDRRGRNFGRPFTECPTRTAGMALRRSSAFLGSTASTARQR